MFLIRLLVNAAALWVATRLVPGVTYSGELLPLLGVALVFGIVNAFIRPVAKLLTLPLIILTLGIFALIVNGLMLWLTSSLSESLGLGLSRQRILGGAVWLARREHRQHPALDVRAGRLNALTRTAPAG